MSFQAQPGLVGLSAPNVAPARRANQLEIGRVVAVHTDTDTIDVALLQGGNLSNVPVLESFAGRRFGEAGLPPVTYGNGTSTATGEDDTFAIIGFMRGQAEMPVVLGFMGPRDNALLKRPDGTIIRRSVGGQVEIFYPDGAIEWHVPGGVMRLAVDGAATTLDPALRPAEGPAASLYINGVPVGGGTLPTHADSHSSTGTDPITPAMIGAAAATHNHDGTYAPVNHNHDGTYAPIGHNHDGTYAKVNFNNTFTGHQLINGALEVRTDTGGNLVVSRFSGGTRIDFYVNGAVADQSLLFFGGDASNGFKMTTFGVQATTINLVGAVALNGSLSVAAGGITSEVWQTPTFANGWSNFGNGWDGAAYFKDALGIVHLRGMVKGGTIGQAIFTLPVGYRPSGPLLFPTIATDAIGRIDIDTTGAVKFLSGTATWVTLSGVRFRAA